jgi:TonB family protein
MFLPLLLGSVVAATPTSPPPWFSFTDYPQKAFDKEWQGTTNFALLIAPDGRVAKCSILKSSGHELLDRETCRLARGRARFAPATGADGAPAYGVYRSQVVWARPDREGVNPDVGPDLELTVAQLPGGTKQPIGVMLAYMVDARGNPSSCTALPASRGQPQTLVDLACREWLSRAVRAPVTGPANEPVSAVQTAAVQFTPGK